MPDVAPSALPIPLDERPCTSACPCRRGERMFTFSTRSYRPERKVRCHHCGWTVTGRASDTTTFEKADAHECRPEARS